jgi:hypothetical protein
MNIIQTFSRDMGVEEVRKQKSEWFAWMVQLPSTTRSTRAFDALDGELCGRQLFPKLRFSSLHATLGHGKHGQIQKIAIGVGNV